MATFTRKVKKHNFALTAAAFRILPKLFSRVSFSKQTIKRYSQRKKVKLWLKMCGEITKAIKLNRLCKSLT